MPLGMFLCVRDLQTIEGHTTYNGAWNSYNTIRETVGKKAGQKITFWDYSKVEGVPVDQLFAFLQQPQKNFIRSA